MHKVATIHQQPARSWALPRMWGLEAKSNNAPGQAERASGHEMTGNWPCPTLSFICSFNKQVPAVGQVPCWHRTECNEHGGPISSCLPSNRRG